MNADLWRRAKEIYHLVAELDPAQRQEYLTIACAGDNELRKEVKSLLACRRDAADLMTSPALDAAAKELAREQALEAAL